MSAITSPSFGQSTALVAEREIKSKLHSKAGTKIRPLLR